MKNDLRDHRIDVSVIRHESIVGVAVLAGPRLALIGARSITLQAQIQMVGDVSLRLARFLLGPRSEFHEVAQTGFLTKTLGLQDSFVNFRCNILAQIRMKQGRQRGG